MTFAAKFIVASIFVALFSCASATTGAPSANPLLGKWVLMESVEGSQRPREVEWEFTDDEVIVRNLRSNTEISRRRYTADLSKEPKWITTDLGKEIFRIIGDELQIKVARGAEPRPSGFVPLDGALIFKRPTEAIYERWRASSVDVGALPEIPADLQWKEIVNRAFRFSVPRDFQSRDVQGIDSFVGEFFGAGMELSFDYGMYSGDFVDWPTETSYEVVSLDGKPARIGIVKWGAREGFSFLAMIHVELADDLALNMHAACNSEEQLALARKIFLSIKFVEKRDP